MEPQNILMGLVQKEYKAGQQGLASEVWKKKVISTSAKTRAPSHFMLNKRQSLSPLASRRTDLAERTEYREMC